MSELTSPQGHNVVVEAGGLSLAGDLYLPDNALGMVAFAHGSGSSRFSPRNREVARYLNERGLGTLLFDLLSGEEHELDEFTREYRFNVPLLGERMVGTVDWLRRRRDAGNLPLGLFGASTGAAAALIAAAERPDDVAAVVSRGGRPDLAKDHLARVRAATLLIVGGDDAPVIDMNGTAARQLTCEREVSIVPGATHLFEEPGKLEEVCRLAADWFVRHFQGRESP